MLRTVTFDLNLLNTFFTILIVAKSDPLPQYLSSSIGIFSL